MPALSHWFGIKPADVADLTTTEVETYLEAIKEMSKSASKH